MKIRKSSAGVDKVEQQMTPMIDIVFQLLTFFLFSFKIAAVEGDFSIKMPVAGGASASDETLPPIKVKLAASPGGKLASIHMNDKALDSFSALHSQILSIVGGQGGPSAADDVEVELDCDYGLHYENVMKAITAISGDIDDAGHIMKLVQKIKFSPPKPPSSG
jgi:biopolymer transport protein ExbD